MHGLSKLEIHRSAATDSVTANLLVQKHLIESYMVNESCSRSHCGVQVLIFLLALVSNLELSAQIVYYCHYITTPI